MKLKNWSELPELMKNDMVKPYYQILNKKKGSLLIKRIFDVVISAVLLVLLSPIMILIAILIKTDSEGPVFFRQRRVTTYGRVFRIFKFRTMVNNADKIGSQVTTQNDSRVTKIGEKIRGCRLDELPQLLNVLAGDMTFVGTRPEVEKYVDCYNDEMYATLLMPAGITSRASIEYKDEERLLKDCDNIDTVYIQQILPNKMKYNLNAIRDFSLFADLKTMIMTVVAIVK